MSYRLLGLVLPGFALAAAEPVFTPVQPVAPAADADPVVTAPAPAQPIGEPPAWSTQGKLGAYASSVVTGGTSTSRDPTIATSNEALSWRVSFDFGLDWKQGKHSVDQDLLGKYARKKEADRSWTEDTDEVRYDGVYRYTFEAPHFAYGSWGWESVFTGPEPEENPFSPGLLKSGAGYGQRYERLFVDGLIAEGRLGAAARRRYGSPYPHEQTEWETGLEAFARLEQKIVDRWSWFVQYEAFGEFEDLGHVTNLGTAGLTSHLTKYLVFELGLRAYYETRPDDVTKTPDDGYNSLSGRQDTLLGIVYDW